MLAHLHGHGAEFAPLKGGNRVKSPGQKNIAMKNTLLIIPSAKAKNPKIVWIAQALLFIYLSMNFSPAAFSAAEGLPSALKTNEQENTSGAQIQGRISKSLLEMTSIPDLFFPYGPFIANTLIPNESIYFQPDVGLDSKTGLPYDHLRIRLAKGQIGERGNYTAASKMSLAIPYLLGVMQRKPIFEKAKLSPETAADLLERALKTLRRYRVEYPDFDGFLAWSDIRSNGTIVPAWNKMPSLDNGQLTWALASVAAALADSPEPRFRAMSQMAQNFLDSQNYSKFYDSKKQLLHGTIQYNSLTRTWTGDKTYYLNDMFEGTLAVLWAVLNRHVPEEAWLNLSVPTVDTMTSDGQIVTTLKGYRASFHEHWGLIYLPIMKSALAPLYQNYLYVQADYARSHGLPGFLSTSYDANGNYRQMGVPEIAAQPVDRSDVAVIFATAMSMLISPSVGVRWTENILNFRGVMTPYGAVESVAHDGYADIMTADGKGLTLLSASGGVLNEVEKYLKTHNVPGTKISMYAKLLDLLEAKHRQMLKDRAGRPVQMPKKSFPLPSPHQIRVEVKSIPQAGTEYSITDHLQQGHLHGKNVLSIGLPTMEDDLRPGQDFTFTYEVPSEMSYFDQWAFRGTYLDQTLGIVNMRYLSASIPADTPPVRFDLEIKSDDITLAHATIDTAKPGILSPDKKWKTYVEKIAVIPESDYKPSNYFSVTMHDPGYLFGDYMPYARQGNIRLRNIKLYRHAPGQPAGAEEASKEKPDETVGDVEVIQYWRTSHGTLEVGKDENAKTFVFPGKRGWKGGYLPYIALDKFRYLHIRARNLSRTCNCFYLELKNENNEILGQKFPVKMSSNRKWYTFEVRLPDDLKTPLNYLAFSDPLGEFEISSIAFSDLAANRYSDHLVVIDKKTPLKCESACSTVTS